MTEDQHIELQKDLESSGFNHIRIIDDTIECQFLIEDKEVKLNCLLSPCFPYELPTISIDSESYKIFAPLPHVNPDLSICTFDRAVCIPNFLFPVQIIKASLHQARKTIVDGISGKNHADFFLEIDAYWQADCSCYADSIVTTNDTIKTVKLFWGAKQVYVADTKQALDRYLSNLGITKRLEKDYFDCLYLPLSIELSPPFPTTNLELFKLLQTDHAICNTYRDFLQKNMTKGAFILTATPTKDAKCLQLWLHPRVSASVPGFRKGRVPANIAFLYDTQQKPIAKFYVANMAQKRLFFRGGEGMHSHISKCAIIGCGSIGGYLTEALSEYGISHFVLNDNDTISTDNIARHLCGYEYVGQPKTTALSTFLKKHNPNICTEIFDENAITFLDKHQSIVNTCDCIFIATAYTPLEYKALEYFNNRAIEKPLVILWVEPHLAAGHAFIMQKPQDIFSEFFDSEYVFQHRVVKNYSAFAKKESGCQSTFIPYSAFHLKRFIYTFLDFLMRDIFRKQKEGNYLFTWCGDLSQIKDLEGILEKEWDNADSFSTYITRID